MKIGKNSTAKTSSGERAGIKSYPTADTIAYMVIAERETKASIQDQVVSHPLEPCTDIDVRVVRREAGLRQDLSGDVGVREMQTGKAAGSRGQVLEDAAHIPMRSLCL